MTFIQLTAWTVWAAFILIVVLISAVQLLKLRHREKGMRTWPHTTAAVIGHKEVADSFGSGEVEAGQLNSFHSIYKYTGTDGATYEGKTTESKINPLPKGSRIVVCINPARPAESYPVQRTSRLALLSTLIVVSAFCVASFFFVRFLVGP
jgi:hypothetical protein